MSVCYIIQRQDCPFEKWYMHLCQWLQPSHDRKNSQMVSLPATGHITVQLFDWWPVKYPLRKFITRFQIWVTGTWFWPWSYKISSNIGLYVHLFINVRQYSKEFWIAQFLVALLVCQLHACGAQLGTLLQLALTLRLFPLLCKISCVWALWRAQAGRVQCPRAVRYIMPVFFSLMTTKTMTKTFSVIVDETKTKTKIKTN